MLTTGGRDKERQSENMVFTLFFLSWILFFMMAQEIFLKKKKRQNDYYLKNKEVSPCSYNVKYYTPKNKGPVPQGLHQLTPPAAEISTFRGKEPRWPQLIALKCDVLSGLSAWWDLKSLRGHSSGPVYSTISWKGWGETLTPKVGESSKRES